MLEVVKERLMQSATADGVLKKTLTCCFFGAGKNNTLAKSRCWVDTTTRWQKKSQCAARLDKVCRLALNNGWMFSFFFLQDSNCTMPNSTHVGVGLIGCIQVASSAKKYQAVSCRVKGAQFFFKENYFSGVCELFL